MNSKADDSVTRNLIVRGNVEVLAQAESLLNKLSDAQYSKVPSHYAESSIGQHTRHVLDIYHAVFQAVNEAKAVIDYDLRRRGSDIEANRSVAISAISQACQQLHLLAKTAVWPELRVSTEVLLSSKEPVIVPSKLERELVFAGSHAVHHLALMGVIAKLLGIAVPESLGVAPTTASFMREQPKGVV